MELALWEARTRAVEELLHLDEGLTPIGELFGTELEDVEVARATYTRPGEPQETAELRALYRNYHREARRQHARALEEGGEAQPDGSRKAVLRSMVMTSTVEYRDDEPWAVRVTDQVTGGEPTVLERDGSRVRIRQPGRDWTFRAEDERIEWLSEEGRTWILGDGSLERC